MEIKEIILEQLILEAKKKKKKSKKKKGTKKDACYHKVRSRYDVWPSAYASGALVKCRKVGAANWGNSKKESEDVHVDVVEEKWSKKYKKSIDCNNPKGFSQKAHCKGKLKEELISEDGKNCADTEKGCIRKRKSGWVILNNKKGGVWRKCDSKKHCEEILDAFHASK